MEEIPLVTVFTPLYNRDYNLKNIYKSLLNQSNYNFEWLIINDGSTDNSDILCNEIIHSHDNNLFKIRYYKRENKGLMFSLNEAFDIAKGEAFFRLDSDDKALNNAIESINKNWHLVEANPKICGLTFLSIQNNGEIFGFHPFVENTIANFANYRYKYKAIGDRAEIVKTNILRQFKFPSFENENFCPEDVVWHRIAEKFDTIYINEPIFIKGEGEDSITSKIYNYLRKNSNGTSLLYFESLSNKKYPLKYRWLNGVKYFRYAFFSKRKVFKNIPLWIIFTSLPPSLIIILYDYLFNYKR